MRELKIFLGALAITAGAVFAGPYDAWSNYRGITLYTTDTANGGAGVAGAVTNFPLLVRLSPSSAAAGGDVLAGALPGGADVRFTSADGETALSYEIESWNASGAAIWVKVPSVAGNDSTKLRIYWGMAGQTSLSSGPAVFDTADGYRSVWHMGNASGQNPRPNSTMFTGLTPRPRNYPMGFNPAVSGVAGMADTMLFGRVGGNTTAVGSGFDTLAGTPGYHGTWMTIDSNIATGADTMALNFPEGRFTISFWANHARHSATKRHFHFQSIAPNGAGNPAGAIQTIPMNEADSATMHFRFSGLDTTGTPQWRYMGGNAGGRFLKLNEWVHITAVVRRFGDRDSLYKYINGVLMNVTAGSSQRIADGSASMPEVRRPYAFLGRAFEGAGDSTFGGSMDEIQILNRSAGDDWVRLTYGTQRPNATATVLGARVFNGTAAAPTAPTSATAVAGNASATVSWMSPANDGGASVTSYTATSSPGNQTCTTSGITCTISGLTNGTSYTFTVRATNSVGQGPVSNVAGPVTPAAPLNAPDSTWANSTTITVNTDSTSGGAGVFETVANFPLLVRLSNASAATGAAVLSGSLSAGGADVRFTDTTGAVTYPHEIEMWSATAAAIWVKVPSVAGGGPTKLRMWWGKTGQSYVSNGAAVFEHSNGFRSVWHMGNASAQNPRPNSSMYSLPATPRNYPNGVNPAVMGAIGMADTLLGGLGGQQGTANDGTYWVVDSGEVVTDAYNFPNGMFTVSFWANQTRFSGTSGGNGCNSRHFQMLTSGNNSNAPVNALQTIPSCTNGSATEGTLYFRYRAGTSYRGGNAGGAVLRHNVWQHIVGVIYRGSTGTDSLIKYVNGVEINRAGTGSGSNNQMADAARNYLFFGRAFEGNSDSAFAGSLDEIRFANASRSAGWVKLEYETQKPGATAVNLGLSTGGGGNTVPDAPTGVAGVRGNTQVTVSWTAPANNGGSPINAYTVTASPGGQICLTTGALTCTVTGLTNGTSYTFTVTAQNSVGTSPASSPSTAVTPATVPNAPTGVTANLGTPTSAVVAWTAPAVNGGSAITGYTATSTPGNLTCTTTGALTCTVTGLAGMTTYTFRVTAQNAVGASAPSDASAPVTGIAPASFVMRVTGGARPYAFSIPAAAAAVTDKVTLTIIEPRGKQVWSRTINPSRDGIREIEWDGRATNGMRAGSGMYVVRISVESGGEVTRLQEKTVTLER